MRYELIIEAAAKKHLQLFLEYAQFEPAATRFIEDLVRRVQILRDFPKLGRLGDKIDGVQYRFLIIEKWRAIYVVDDEMKSIRITIFLHPSQLFDISVYLER